jgi:condensin complex subunit 2
MYNKINSKNAFDVNSDFLEHLPNIIDTNDCAQWSKYSTTLEAASKIWGYRVESLHTDMFKFLGGLHRTEHKEEEEGGKKKRSGDDNENVHDIFDS